MKKIIFVCHVNICRSPASEIIFNLKARESNLNFYSVSFALSDEEISNDIYPPMKTCLKNNGISFSKHEARKLTQEDIDSSFLLFYMDKSNERILFSNYKADKNKCMKISCFSKNIDDIEDPWYTGRYQKVIDEISICTDDIISYLIKEESKRDQL